MENECTSQSRHCLICVKSEHTEDLHIDHNYAASEESIAAAEHRAQIRNTILNRSSFVWDEKTNPVHSNTGQLNTTPNDFNWVCGKKNETANSKTNHLLETPDLSVVSEQVKQSINSNTDQGFATTHGHISLCGTVSKIDYSKNLETDAKLYDINSVCEKTVQTDYNICLDAPMNSKSEIDGNGTMICV
ncbi:hypothetical protein DPMN_023375 [Dreissena polymorpha]|uniref:Uncharacterized protein n=1 Tax=Dreissena polymorpha TaxID=45954 RepID=A0A9D4RBQ3_DREPO|nr:hypothetical protein DPMN_023375 [Dreissena polymorpha]